MHHANPQKEHQARRTRRRARVRAIVRGIAARPRLVASRTLAHIHAQIVDDESARTIVSASDVALQMDSVAVGSRKGKVAKAYAVGMLIAARAKEQGITKVVFDRAGRKYHGRVAALAEGARDGGLLF